MSASIFDAAERGHRWSSRALSFVVQALIAITFVWWFVRASRFVWYAMFTNFAGYDDEGYLLLSVREFLSGRPLYNEVFTQYGPAYYAFKHLLSLVQGLPTQEITRSTTMGLWLSSCGALGLAALWLTRSGIAAMVTFGSMLSALLALRSEPGHPQDLLILLTSLSVAVAASPLKDYTRAVILTVLATLCGFTKINVGIFVGLAIVGTLLPAGPGAIRTVVALVLAAVPPLLMSRYLLEWAWPYALATSAAIVTGVTMAPDAAVRVWPFRKSAPILAAVVLPAVLLLVYLIARGSTLSAIASGVILRPLAMADIYVNPFRLLPRSAAISLLAAALALSAARRDSAVGAWLTSTIPSIKIAAGLYFLFWLDTNKAEMVGLSAVLVFALFAGLESMPPRDRLGRTFLGLSAAFHTCTAYPVAGSQMWWSTYLLIMAAVICIWDGTERLRAAVAESALVNRTLATGLTCFALSINFATTTPLNAMNGLYYSAVALPFPGTSSIHIDASQAGLYSWLVANLRARCSAFVALPGYNMLHVWSGMRPVTGFNAGGAWMLQLNDAEQIENVERLVHAERPCAVYAPANVALWTSRPIADRPLVAYVLGLTTVAARSGYEIRVPANQAAAWSFEYLLAGRRAFNASVPPYPGPISALSPVGSVRLWFKTRESGVLIGAQTGPPSQSPAAWFPVLYVGQDGRVHAELWNGRVEPMASASALNDGIWHHAVLVASAQRQALYIDGAFASDLGPAVETGWGDTLQIGNGFTASWPAGNGGWFPFSGEVRDAIVSSQPWDADAVFRDYVQTADGEASR